MLRTKFATEIERLKADNVELLELIISQHKKAQKALQEENLKLCEEVVDNDKKINEFYVRIFETGIWRIAKQQPVASDLRHIIGYMSIARELERVGDYARNIAYFYITQQPPLKYTKYIAEMADQALKMLELTRKILSDEARWDEAKSIIKMDDIIDKTYVEVNSELIKLVLKNVTEAKIRIYTGVMQQLKYLERTGDHVVNIAETLLLISHGLHFDSGR